MASLDELLNSGLGGIIQSGGLPTEEALYNRQAQAERESTFGRGLGISSVTRDALAKARTDAALAAQSAQLSALGQAAAVTQARDARTQQESQFSRTQDLQKKQLGQQKDLANTQLIAGGVGAGVGALGSLAGASFGPEIRGGVRSLAGLGPLRQDAAGGALTPGGQMPGAGASPGAMPSFDAGSGGGPSLNDFQMPTTSFGSQDFSVPDYNFGGGGGGLDLSSLYDFATPQFNQFDWGNYY